MQVSLNFINKDGWKASSPSLKLKHLSLAANNQLFSISADINECSHLPSLTSSSRSLV